jgi:hypothetical protein
LIFLGLLFLQKIFCRKRAFLIVSIVGVFWKWSILI